MLHLTENSRALQTFTLNDGKSQLMNESKLVSIQTELEIQSYICDYNESDDDPDILEILQHFNFIFIQ